MSHDASLIQRAKDWGKIKRKFLYNVILLDNPQAHLGQDGLPRPLILDAGPMLQPQIVDLIKQLNGATNLVDYQIGRPLRLTKKKTGMNDMDVEYSINVANLNGAEPLPPQFYAMTHNLWDLKKIAQVSTPEQIQKAIMEMGLPMPNGGAPPAFQQQPQPAYPSPYPPQSGYPPAAGAPGYPPPAPGGYPPPGYPPPAAPPPAYPPQQPAYPGYPPQQQQAPVYPPQQPAYPPPVPGGYPPPAGPMMQPPPPYNGAPGGYPPQGPPPNLVPPPVSLPPSPGYPPGAYQPQPSQAPGGAPLQAPLGPT